MNIQEINIPPLELSLLITSEKSWFPLKPTLPTPKVNEILKLVEDDGEDWILSRVTHIARIMDEDSKETLLYIISCETVTTIYNEIRL
jgi:predicted Zn-ribbon and HTH transcriptional regulator